MVQYGAVSDHNLLLVLPNLHHYIILYDCSDTMVFVAMLMLVMNAYMVVT